MKSIALLSLLPTAAFGHGVPRLNVTGAEAGCPDDSAQECNLLFGTLRQLHDNLDCIPNVSELCDDISQTLGVLEGKGQPLFADQRYLLEELQLIAGYSQTFYGQSEKSCAEGDQSTCGHKRANYPGPEAQSYLTSTEIAEKMSKVPELQGSGKITRRNMLGYLLLNDMFWYDLPEGNQGLGLGGQSVELHRMVRPKIDAAFGDGAFDPGRIEQSARDFINSKSQMSFQSDVMVWVQQVLHEVTYGVKISEQEALEFTDFQSKVLKTVVVPQFIVDTARSIPFGENMLKSAIGFQEVQKRKDNYLQRWLPVTKARFCQNCGDEEAAIVNTNLLDGLIFAGGLSVPGVVAPGTAVLHAGDKSPAPGMRLTPENAQAFAWEATRYFPPVLGFGYVDKTKAQPLQMMALGVGQRSAEAWGDDAETPTFRLRDMQTYQRWWVGHADHAEDPSGEMTRRCPGKHLSMTMIESWFKAWDQSAWAPADNTNFKFNDFALFALDFTMVRVARDDDMIV